MEEEGKRRDDRSTMGADTRTMYEINKAKSTYCWSRIRRRHHPGAATTTGSAEKNEFRHERARETLAYIRMPRMQGEQ